METPSGRTLLDGSVPLGSKREGMPADDNILCIRSLSAE